MTEISIDDITSANLVALDLEAGDQWAAIDALADLLDADGRLSDRDSYVQAVIAREKDTGGTAMGMGIAIPHAKASGVQTAGVAFGRPSAPLPYGEEEADLIFMIAAPEGEHNFHVKVLQQLARRLMHESFREGLRAASSPEEVVDLMRAQIST
jgi:mannitol/fructose-specific phosphotransferase system IIA component (Ntr-type)